MEVPHLRSPYEQLDGIFYFPRLLDKIRLNQAGELPEDYQMNLGKGFDGRCARFLGVGYEALADRVREGMTDEEALDWAFKNGRRPGEEEIEVWNTFMRKVGWNDGVTETLERRKREGGCTERTDIQTIFDLIDLDEGRKQ